MNTSTAFRGLCGALLFAFPASVLVISDIGSVFFFLLALLGLATLLSPGTRAPLPRDVKLIFYAMLVFVAVAVLSYLIVDMSEISLKKLGRYARFLLLIPIFYLLRRVRVPPQALWYGCGVGAIVAGFAAMDQVWWHLLFEASDRATGSVHPIIFGDMALLLGVLSLAGLSYFWQQGRALITLPILAALLGLLASFLSASRGGWLALPAFAVLFAWYGQRHLQIRLWHYAAVATMLVIIVMTAYLVPQTGVQARIAEAVHEVSDYFTYRAAETSVGARLEMWKAAWRIFRDHPLFGSGLGDGYVAAKQALIDNGDADLILAEFDHPHSEYLAALATRGLIGLSALLVLFIAPARVFFLWTRDGAGQQRAAGFGGLILMIAFMHFSITGDTFDRALPITFLTFFLAAFAALGAQTPEQDKFKAQ